MKVHERCMRSNAKSASALAQRCEYGGGMKKKAGESAELLTNEGFHARSGLFDALQETDLIGGAL